MNKEQNYHIDTSEEEATLFVDPPVEKKPSIKLPPFPKISLSFPKIFCVVLGVHILLGVALFGTTLKDSSKEEDKKALVEPTPTPAPVPEASPSPTPHVVIQEPVPKIIQKPAATPKPTPKVDSKAPATSPNNVPKGKYTEKYIVKQGDTFHKIVQKFKLNAEKLQKINNIKDPNKIVVGQTLKFM